MENNKKVKKDEILRMRISKEDKSKVAYLASERGTTMSKFIIELVNKAYEESME